MQCVLSLQPFGCMVCFSHLFSSDFGYHAFLLPFYNTSVFCQASIILEPSRLHVPSRKMRLCSSCHITLNSLVCSTPKLYACLVVYSGLLCIFERAGACQLPKPAELQITKIVKIIRYCSKCLPDTHASLTWLHSKAH